MDTECAFDQSALRQRYNPDGSVLRCDQLELLNMLRSLAKICDDNGIRWWLSSGTLLGAARHKGFIPWDDDVDIVMMRKDYLRLQKILRKMQSSEYVFHSMHTDPDYVNVFGKFRKREGRVRLVGKRYKHLKYQGQFIDIFLIERTPYWVARAAYVIYMNAQYITVYIKCNWLRRTLIRLIEGLCLGIINPVLRLLGLINPKREYHYTLGMGWARSTFFKRDIFPLKTIEFEGEMFPAPKDVDAYLRNVYGDWRKLPDEESIRRSIHSTEYIDEIYGK